MKLSRLKIIILPQVSRYDFEPIVIILVLIGTILPDQPKYKKITKHLTSNKYPSLLNFCAFSSMKGLSKRTSQTDFAQKKGNGEFKHYLSHQKCTFKS